MYDNSPRGEQKHNFQSLFEKVRDELNELGMYEEETREWGNEQYQRAEKLQEELNDMEEAKDELFVENNRLQSEIDNLNEKLSA